MLDLIYIRMLFLFLLSYLQDKPLREGEKGFFFFMLFVLRSASLPVCKDPGERI